jgi:transcriptional regulator with XRE-family HTH domain
VSEPQATYIARRLPRRRSELGLSQRGLATQLGVSKAAVESWEQSRREPGGDVLPEVERLIALGERGEDEHEPLYLIASVESDGRPLPYLDRSQRPCALPGRPLAHQIVAFLRQGGEQHAAAVPVWQSHLRRLLVANARDGDDPEQVVARSVGLDTSLDLAAYHARLLRWATEVIEKLAEGRPQ